MKWALQDADFLPLHIIRSQDWELAQGVARAIDEKAYYLETVRLIFGGDLSQEPAEEEAGRHA